MRSAQIRVGAVVECFEGWRRKQPWVGTVEVADGPWFVVRPVPGTRLRWRGLRWQEPLKGCADVHARQIARVMP